MNTSTSPFSLDLKVKKVRKAVMMPIKSIYESAKTKLNSMERGPRHMLLAALIGLVMVWVFIPCGKMLVATAWYTVPVIVTMAMAVTVNVVLFAIGFINFLDD